MDSCARSTKATPSAHDEQRITPTEAVGFGRIGFGIGAQAAIDEQFVSVTARRQAQLNGNSDEDECIALVVHGLLHLAGYEHETDAQEAEMQLRAAELLALAGVETKVYGH